MDRRLLSTVITVDLSVFLYALDVTIVGAAAPTIVAQLGRIELFSSVFSAYAFASTATMVIAGKLADLKGTRATLVGSIGIFLLGSTLSGSASSMEQLILFRAIQGVGGGATFTVAMVIFGETFPPERRGRSQGVLSAVWAGSSILGPAIGALILEALDWRWIFFINLPVGAVAATLAARTLRLGRTSVEVKPFDLKGFTWLTGGVLAVLFLLQLLGDAKGALPITIGTASAAIILLYAFMRTERAAREPIIPLGLLRIPAFSVSNILGALLGASLLGSVGYIPLFVQGVLGGLPREAGSSLIPLSLGWSFGSIVGGRLVNRAGYRVLASVGSALILLSYVLISGMSSETAALSVLYYTALAGIGMGIVTVTTVVAVQNSVPRSQMGVATSTNIFVRSMGGAVGIALLGSVFSLQLGGLSFQDRQMLSRLTLNRASISLDSLRHLSGVLFTALHAVFLSSLVIALGALISALRMPSESPTKRAKPKG